MKKEEEMKNKEFEALLNRKYTLEELSKIAVYNNLRSIDNGILLSAVIDLLIEKEVIDKEELAVRMNMISSKLANENLKRMKQENKEQSNIIKIDEIKNKLEK